MDEDDIQAAKDGFIREVYEQGDRNPHRIVKRARELIAKDLAENHEVEKGDAEELSKHLTLADVRQWIKDKAEVLTNEKKDEIIEAVYKTHFGSLADTLKRARLINSQITMEDVKRWRTENENAEKKPTKYNSWVAGESREEFQIDLFFFDDLKPRDPKTKKKETQDINAALMVVDIFSKRCRVELLSNKEDKTIRDALKEAFRVMGYPRQIYSDAESAFRSELVQNFLKKNNVKSIFTLTHAPVAERTIETIKNMLMRRIDKDTEKWWEVLPKVVEDYNKKHVSSATGMTPEKAGQFVNKKEVKINLEKIRHNDNDQPVIGPLDEVRIIKKKSTFDKGYVPQFSDKTYIVKTAKYSKKRDVPEWMYELYGDPPPRFKNKTFMRHELQLVKKDTSGLAPPE
jgi:hypothetical protein